MEPTLGWGAGDGAEMEAGVGGVRLPGLTRLEMAKWKLSCCFGSKEKIKAATVLLSITNPALLGLPFGEGRLLSFLRNQLLAVVRHPPSLPRGSCRSWGDRVAGPQS